MANKSPNPIRVIFFVSSGDRLRAGWRLILHTILILVFSVVLGIIIFIPVGLLNINFDSPIALLANEITLGISITAATFLSRRFLDKQSMESLGLIPGIQSVIDILVGFSITFFLMSLVYGIEFSLGWTKFEGFAWSSVPLPTLASDLGIWLLIFLLVGWQEELLSRGYHLQTITSGSNLTIGVLFSSAVFGILHIFNPGASWISTLGIVLAGFFLALPYILTRQLWLSIGLHIGWNFFEGVVFGFPVSGLETFQLLRHKVTGPEIWTGGAFGPEAGLIIIPALALGSLLIFAYSKSKIRNQIK